MPPPVLTLLLAANAGLYAWMVHVTGATSFGTRTLLRWGANYGPLSLGPEPARLIEATFLHASLSHLAGNMILLLIAGAFVERIVGPLRFAAAYLLCGLAASLASVYAHPASVGVGASGAIAGIVGIVVVFYASPRNPGISGAWVAQTVGLNVLYSFAPDVDWAAHLGGFVAGLAAGSVLVGLPPPQRGA